MAGYFNEKKWFFIALLVGALLFLMPTPNELSRDGHIVIMMTVVATILFVTAPIPLPTVALLIVVAQVLLLNIDSTEVARSLMNDSVLFIMGSLMLAVAVVKQKLDKRIALFIVRLSGTSTIRIAFGISAVSGLLASFIGEHTVAAMMLPVGLTLIKLTADQGIPVKRLSAFLLFSIAYGCSIAGIGTPSGGARNAIMISYWEDFFYDPSVPATSSYLVSYLQWMIYSYPIFLLQLPLMTALLYFTFRPETKDLRRAVVKLKEQVEAEGPMKPYHWLTVGLFVLILSGWIGISSEIGLGTIALLGIIAFLVARLVEWEDLDNGVNWGVVLLYAAAMSLGFRMQETGAAAWLANSFLTALAPIGADEGVGLLASVSFLTTAMTNTMSNGAAVAVLGPIVLQMADGAGESPLILGFITAVSSAFAYFTVIGTPACTIIYSSGYLKTTDFLKVGWRMFVMSFLVLMLYATVYWPLLGN